MPHLEVIIDGKPFYDGEVDEHVIPSRPELIPAALRPAAAELNPNAKPTPMARLFLLTTLTELFRKTFTEHPLLQPLDVDFRSRGRGSFTMKVDMPPVNQ
jgi:hypothetical protein